MFLSTTYKKYWCCTDEQKQMLSRLVLFPNCKCQGRLREAVFLSRSDLRSMGLCKSAVPPGPLLSGLSKLDCSGREAGSERHGQALKSATVF